MPIADIKIFCPHCCSIQNCTTLSLYDSWQWICNNCGRIADSEFKRDDDSIEEYEQ